MVDWKAFHRDKFLFSSAFGIKTEVEERKSELVPIAIKRELIE